MTLFNANYLVKLIVTIIYALFASFVLLFLGNNFVMMAILMMAPLAMVFLLNKPISLFKILLFLIPFSSIIFIDMQLMGIPGLKIINILFVLILISFICKKHLINIQLNETLFISGLLVLLTIAVIRSLPHITLFNIIWNENFSVIRYVQSFLFKPIIFFSPFIFLSLFILPRKDFNQIINVYMWSITTLSIVLLGIYIFFVPDKSSFEGVRQTLGSIMHLHGNNMATIYTISFPLIMSYCFIKRNIFSIVNLVLAVIAIGILYSRTAYVLIVFSIFLYFIMSKRFRFLPYIFFVGILLGFLMPSSITDRLMTGIESKDRYKISAGRIDDIWIPLLKEVGNSPITMIAGRGRHAIIYSDAHTKGIIHRTGHAHNMYLDSLLDVGLLGLLFFLGFFLFYLGRYIEHTKKSHALEAKDRELLYGISVSIVCFLLAGLAGRNFFPMLPNYSIWFVLAIGNIIIKKEKQAIPSAGRLS